MTGEGASGPGEWNTWPTAELSPTCTNLSLLFFLFSFFSFFFCLFLSPAFFLFFFLLLFSIFSFVILYLIPVSVFLGHLSDCMECCLLVLFFSCIHVRFGLYCFLS